MEQSNPTDTPPSSPTSSPSPADVLSRIDFQLLKARVMGLLQSPAATLEQLRAENDSISDLYQKYIFALVAFPALAAFIGISLLGPGTVMGGVVAVILKLVLGLVGIYLAMLLVQQISPYFGGTKSAPEILKWLVAGMFVSAAANCLQLFYFIPMAGFVIGLIGFLAALYSLYVSWLGLPILLEVKDNKRLPFFLTLIGVGIVLAVVMGILGMSNILIMG